MPPTSPASPSSLTFAPADFRDASADAARAARRVPAETAVTGGVLQVTCPSNGRYRVTLRAPVPAQAGRNYHLDLVCWARPLVEGRPHPAVIRYALREGAGPDAAPIAGVSVAKTITLGEGGYKTYTFVVSVPAGAAPAATLLDVELTNEGLAETGGTLKISRAAWRPEPQDREVIPLWPADLPPGQTTLPPNQEYLDANGRYIRDISRPRLIVYPPPETNRQPVGVIICSGGSFHLLEPMAPYAAWLNALGITAFELRYRVPSKSNEPLKALQDAQRALSLVRSRAAAFGIGTLGIMGPSAGAHLSLMAATQFNRRSYDPVDAADAFERRPDFVISLCAPYALKPDGSLSDDLRVDDRTPPVFFAHGGADKHTAVNSTTLYNEFRQRGIPAELHVWAKAGHGIGLESETGQAWTVLSERWLRTLGFLPAPEPR